MANSWARGAVYQMLVIGALVWGVYFLAANTAQNLELRGMLTGFGFLSVTAGFDVDFTLIGYRLGVDTYGRIFVIAILNTVFIAVFVIVASTFMAFVVGIARLSPNWLIARLALAYVEVIRNIPVLMHLVFWHVTGLHALPLVGQSINFLGLDFTYLNNRGLFLPRPITGELFWATPAALGFGLVAALCLRRWSGLRRQRTGQTFPVFLCSLGLVLGFPLMVHLATGAPLDWQVPILERFNYMGGVYLPVSFVTMLVALSIYHAAHKAEAVRAGIQSVHKGQMEAAQTIGLGRRQAIRLVLIPQAMRAIIPPLLTGWLSVTRSASLGIVVAYPELVGMFMQTSLNQIGHAVEIVAMVMGFYMAVSLLISLLLNAYNRRVRINEG
ncbi:MAG: ABC transporter permease subunit [Alphaproteobacteria bacterium]